MDSTTLPSENAPIDWQGIEQVFRLERTVRLLKSGEVRHEVVYGLTSLPLVLTGRCYVYQNWKALIKRERPLTNMSAQHKI